MPERDRTCPQCGSDDLVVEYGTDPDELDVLVCFDCALTVKTLPR